MSCYVACRDCKVAKLDPDDNGEAVTEFMQNHVTHETELVVEAIFLSKHLRNGFKDVDRPDLQPIVLRVGDPAANASVEVTLIKTAPFGHPNENSHRRAHVSGVTIPGKTIVREPIALRPSWDEVFLDVARVLARRGTCSRRHVGAVLTKDNRIIATGYNGAPPGLPHCRHSQVLVGESDPDMENGHCSRAEHAERNAMVFCDGWRMKGACIYITCTPCLDCLRMMITAGISRVVYSDEYRPSFKVDEMAAQAGIELVQVL